MEDLLKAMTREPQHVLEQGMRGSALGEGRQILPLVGGEARRGKALSREVVPLSPPLLFPEFPPPTTQPLKLTCLQLILADAHEDEVLGFALDLGQQPPAEQWPPEQQHPPAQDLGTQGWEPHQPPPWPQQGPTAQLLPALPLLSHLSSFPSSLLPLALELPDLEHNLCLPPSHVSAFHSFCLKCPFPLRGLASNLDFATS